MSSPKPPVAAKIPHRIEQLGRVRTDDYAWMKDDNWQQVLRDPKALRADVRDHLNAENAYTKAVLAGTEDLQATLFAEMKGRIKEDDSSVPAPDGPFDYYARYELGAEHPSQIDIAELAEPEESTPCHSERVRQRLLVLHFEEHSIADLAQDSHGIVKSAGAAKAEEDVVRVDGVLGS